MSASSFSSGSDGRSWYTSVEWVLLGILAAMSLTLAILGTQEVRHIRSSSRAIEGGLSHGQQVRRWFVGSIALANGSRGVCLVLESLYVHLYSALNVKPSPLSQFSFLVLPSLLFFTMYTLLTVYLAQLCYAVKGQPFFGVRNTWLLANTTLYLAVLCGLYITCSLDMVASCFTVAIICNLGACSWYAVNVFRFFPSPSSGLSASDGLSKITGQLLPILIVCFSGICCEMVLYALLQQGVIYYDQDAVTLVLVMCAETVPSMVFLNFLSKSQGGGIGSGSGEQRSLLAESTTSADKGPVGGARTPTIGSAGAGNMPLKSYGTDMERYDA